MRRIRTILFGALFLACLGRYFPVFYNATQFNDFVKQAPQKTGVVSKLQNAVMSQASAYFIPIKPGDIQIREESGLLRLKVTYKVPVDFFIFKHELSFEASGAGLLAQVN